MAAFDRQRKLQTYGKAARARQFEAQEQFYNRTTDSIPTIEIDDQSTQPASLAHRLGKQYKAAGAVSSGKRLVAAPATAATLRNTRSQSVESDSGYSRKSHKRDTPDFSDEPTVTVKRHKMLPKPAMQLSSNDDIFDVPHSSGDEAKPKAKTVKAKKPTTTRAKPQPATKVVKHARTPSVESTPKASRATQGPNIKPPPKSYAKQQSQLAAKQKTRPKTPTAKGAATYQRHSPHSSAASTSSVDNITSPVFQTPQKTPRAAATQRVEMSPSVLSMQSLEIKSPRRLTPKTASRRTTPGMDDPFRGLPSESASIFDVMETSPLRTPPRQFIKEQQSPGRRLSFDLPDLSTPKRKRRLIDALADEVDQSPRKRTPVFSETESSDEEADGNVVQDIPHSVYIRPDDVPALEDDHIFESSQEVSSQQRRQIANAGRVRVTYASQRSYLAEEFDINAPLIETPILPGLQGILDAAEPKAKKRANPFDVPDTEPVPAKAAIKSIHELRQAGTNKRSLEEIEVLMEDVEALGESNVSRRRLGLFSIAQKIADANFAERFVEYGFDRRLARVAAAESDILSLCAVAFMCAALLRVDTCSFYEGESQLELLQRMNSLLDDGRTVSLVGRDRKTNMSKYAQTQLASFLTAVSKSEIWNIPEDCRITVQVMSLFAIRAIAQSATGVDVLTQQSSRDVIRNILDLLCGVTASVDNEVLSTNDLARLELLLSILSPYVTRADTFDDDAIWSADVYISLCKLLPSTLQWKFPSAADTRIRILTFYLNLSHENAVVCERLAQQPALFRSLIRNVSECFSMLDGTATDDSQEQVLQSLITVLAVLINLTESSATARNAIAEEQDSTGNFVALLQIFISRQEQIAAADSIEKSKANVALGYVSVLLAILSEVPELCKRLKEKLPGQKLTPLIDILRTFTAVQQKVDEIQIQQSQSQSQLQAHGQIDGNMDVDGHDGVNADQAGGQGADDKQIKRMQAAIDRLSSAA